MEEIHQGDRVTYGGNAGEIELVVEGLVGDPEQDWLFENHGAGIMLIEPKVFGRVYLHTPDEEEDLLFVARLNRVTQDAESRLAAAGRTPSISLG